MIQRALTVILGLALTALGGCLPALQDDCVTDDDCPTDRACVGGICAPRGGIDGAVDGRPPDVADARREMGAEPEPEPPPDHGLDAQPPPPDGGPAIDAGPMPDAALLGDAGCLVEPSACNQLDDDCDGVVDEQSEAVEGCPGVVGALAACGGGGCDYVCMQGAVPLGDDPSAGCRVPRGCTLEGEWSRIADGFEKGDDEAQQVALAAAGDRRFVAAYDLLAERQQPVVRSLIFAVDDLDAVDEVRLGETVEALGADLTGLSAAAVGERFVVGARVDDGGEVGVSIHLMARDADGTELRTLRASWPQDPALVTFEAEGPRLATLVESHVNRADPPIGGLVADVWPEGAEGARAVEPARAAVPRPVGPARNAAFRLADGAVALAGDVVGIGLDGQPSYALRVDRLSADAGIAQSIEGALDGPVVSPISVAAGAGGYVVFAAVDDGDGLLYWRALRADGGAFVGDPITLPWYGPPVAPQALAFPGGVGVIYREGEHLRIALPDPGFEDFAFEGRLPDAPNRMRAFAARQVDGRTLEIAALREAGGQGVIVFGRYVCQ